MQFVIDTHVLIWQMADRHNLSQKALKLLKDPTNRILVSTISLAEIHHTHSRKRIGCSLNAVLERIADASNVFVKSIDKPIIQLMPSSLEIHDSIIVATALREQQLTGEKCPVVTCDRAITESGLVEVVW